MAVREKPYQIYETDAGYILDVQGLSRALDEVEGSPLRSFEPTHLDALLDTFCDWSEVREGNYESVIVPATEAVQRLPVEDKEALYDRLCDDLAERVSVERENPVSREDVVSVVLAFVDFTNEAYDFMLRYLWDFAANLRNLNPEHNDSLEDVGPLLSAIQDLPEPYLATKRNQYEGFRKVREIRYRVLDQIVSGDQVGVEDLDEAIEIVLEKEGESILRAWSPYRIVGQIYYDYFKPRLDFYLVSLAERIDDAYPDHDLEHHIVNFQGSRNLLGDFAWIGLYDGPPGSMQQHRQLFLGFYGDPSVSYGLHLGEELRGDNWEQELDLEEVTERASLSIERVIEKLNRSKKHFLRGLQSAWNPRSRRARLDIFGQRQIQLSGLWRKLKAGAKSATSPITRRETKNEYSTLLKKPQLVTR